LRHVGRGHVAGVEALASGAERLAQKGRIDALRFHQGLVGEDVGVGGHCVEQHPLADIAQGLAPRPSDWRTVFAVSKPLKVSTTTGPTPGVVISLRQTSSWRPAWEWLAAFVNVGRP
jgi:hypothetical protein